MQRPPAEGIEVKIRRSDGFTLIELLVVCAVIGIVAAIAVPGLLMAKTAAGSASAIGSVRTINSSQATFALTCGSGFYAPNLTTLGTPAPGSQIAYISPNLSTGNVVVRSGYSIQVSATPSPAAPATCNGSGAGVAGQGFKAAADPITPDNLRFFGGNSSGMIYEHTSTLFAAMPEVGVSPIGQSLR